MGHTPIARLPASTKSQVLQDMQVAEIREGSSLSNLSEAELRHVTIGISSRVLATILYSNTPYGLCECRPHIAHEGRLEFSTRRQDSGESVCRIDTHPAIRFPTSSQVLYRHY